MVRALAALVSVLTACSIDTWIGGGQDGSVEGRDGYVPGIDGSGLDAEPEPDGGSMVDAPAPDIDAGIDAGSLVPTEAVTVAATGLRNRHASVTWDGSRFVVGVLVATPGGARAEIFGMAPGDVTELDRMPVSDGSRDRETIVIAAGAEGRLAVGYREYD